MYWGTHKTKSDNTINRIKQKYVQFQYEKLQLIFSHKNTTSTTSTKTSKKGHINVQMKESSSSTWKKRVKIKKQHQYYRLWSDILKRLH